MAEYLLDSNHAGALVTIGHKLRRSVRARNTAGDAFHLHVLVLSEVVFGFSTLPRAIQNAREWATWRPLLTLVDLDESDALGAASLRVDLRRRGRQLFLVDAFVAIAALRYNLTLLTTDRDFAAVPLLRTENWM